MIIPFDEPTSVGQPFIDIGQEVATAVLLTIQGGWRSASSQSRVGAGANEVVITECLRDGMRQVLDELPWGRGMIVARGTESKSDAGMAKPDGLTDIPIYVISIRLSSGSHDPHAIVECKRLAEDDSGLVRNYVVQGIDRFRTAKYAPNHRIGFMVGYVVAGTASGAVGRVNAYLRKNNRSPELLGIASLVADDTWMSEHPRPSQSSAIEIHHTMALVREAP